MLHPGVETHHVSEALELYGVAGGERCHGLGNFADKVWHLVAEASERQANSPSSEVQAVTEACHLRSRGKGAARTEGGSGAVDKKIVAVFNFRCVNPSYRTELLIGHFVPGIMCICFRCCGSLIK